MSRKKPMKICLLVLLFLNITLVLSRPICCSNCNRGDSVLELYDLEDPDEDICSKDEVCVTSCSTIVPGCTKKQYLLLDKNSFFVAEAFTTVCVNRKGGFQKSKDRLRLSRDVIWETVSEKLQKYYPEIYKKEIAERNITSFLSATQFVSKIIKENYFVSALVSFVRVVKSFRKVCFKSNNLR